MKKRYALCVGNNYPGTNNELHGCVNDAMDWAELLGRNGYAVQTLVEGKKGDVLEHLRGLVDQAGFGDRIVFTYSGHGTWLPDQNGDEADGRDEAMCMSGLTQADLLIDDELNDLFSQLRFGAGALILSDSCFSGTISRFAGPESAPVAGTPKFLSPVELGVPISFEKAVQLEQAPASKPRRTASLISGCGEHEYSYDASYNGRPNGAFTRVAIDTYEPGASLNNWFKAVRKQLPSNAYPQSPQLTATAYRKYASALG
jgi:hypothetical protein